MSEKPAKQHSITPAMREKLWKPGQSGNPNGRPRTGYAQAELARQVLEGVNKDGLTVGQKIMEKFAHEALAGSVPHATFLFDRGYGKPKEQEFAPDDPLQVQAMALIAEYQESIRDEKERKRFKQFLIARTGEPVAAVGSGR